MLHVQESLNLTIYLCAKTMGQRRKSYIRMFYLVKNIYRYILYVACSRVSKPDNLFICTDNGTAKNVVYSHSVPRNHKNSKKTGLRPKNAKPRS